MDIQGQYRIGVPRQQVWDALTDAEILKLCIPGCDEMQKVSDTEFKAVVTAAIGPVKAVFRTTMELTKLNPPFSYTLVGESKGGAAGFGRGSADITLEETDGATVLHYAADFKVGGKLAQVGSRLVVGVTRKIADQFFGKFSSILDSDAQKVLTEQDRILAERRATRHRILAIAGAIAVGILLIWFFGR